MNLGGFLTPDSSVRLRLSISLPGPPPSPSELNLGSQTLASPPVEPRVIRRMTPSSGRGAQALFRLPGACFLAGSLFQGRRDRGLTRASVSEETATLARARLMITGTPWCGQNSILALQTGKLRLRGVNPVTGIQMRGCILSNT